MNALKVELGAMDGMATNLMAKTGLMTERKPRARSSQLQLVRRYCPLGSVQLTSRMSDKGLTSLHPVLGSHVTEHMICPSLHKMP